MCAKPTEDQYSDADVITLPGGLVGLPALQRWVLLENDPVMPLKWLHSLDREGFRLPVIEPGWFDPDYAFDLDDRAEAALAAAEAGELAVMIVTTVHPGGERVTGNLAAPLIVNINSRKGLQYVLDDRKYSLHAEIDSVRFGMALSAAEAGAEAADAETSVDRCARPEYAEDGDPVLVDG